MDNASKMRVDRKKIRLGLWGLVLVMACVYSAPKKELLSQVWPDALKNARYDELGIRLNIGQDLTLLPGSHWCIMRGDLRKLFAKVERAQGGDFWIPQDLQRWIISEIKPEKKQFNLSPAFRPLVVLDPGHGGKKPGAIGLSGLYEKHLALDISLRVRDLLTKGGIRVIMTRDTDRHFDLYERCQLSNQLKASAFVSIHGNGNVDRNVRGYEVYTQSEKISSWKRANSTIDRKRPGMTLSELYPLPTYQPLRKTGELSGITTHTQLFHWKDRESKRLRSAVDRALKHRKVNSSHKTERSKDLAVLRATMAPSILVEVDYISHPKMEIVMNTHAWREKMAKDIANGILRYFGLTPLS